MTDIPSGAEFTYSQVGLRFGHGEGDASKMIDYAESVVRNSKHSYADVYIKARPDDIRAILCAIAKATERADVFVSTRKYGEVGGMVFDFHG